VRTKLTKHGVEALKPREKPYEERDAALGGLLIRVQPSGIKTFYFDFTMRGKRNRYRLGKYPGLTPEGARDAAKKIAGEIANQINPQERRKAERAQTERAKVSTLGNFVEHRYGPWALEHLRRGDIATSRIKADFDLWMEKPLASLNSWLVESWRKDRLKSGVKPVTLNRQIDTLKAALRKAVDWKVIEAHPLQGLKRLKVDDDERVRYLSSEEESRLRDALIERETKLRAARDRGNEWRRSRKKKLYPPHKGEFVDHIRPLALLALNTGLRRGELFSLHWSDINFKGALLTVRAAAAKSGDSRRVPLNSEALRVLQNWHSQSKKPGAESWVFPGAENERLNNINKGWATVCAGAKLSDFRFHDLRHTFASKLVQNGVDLNTVRELMGHHDIAMTLRYSHLTPGNLSAAVEKLA
jgi:integrase